MGLTPIVPATALALGTYVHAALGEWLINPATSPKSAFMQAASEARKLAIETYREQVGAPISENELDKLNEAIILGAYMCENYENHWTEPLPPDFKVIAQEQRVCVPIPGTEHKSEWLWDVETQTMTQHVYLDTRFHYLEGRLDGIIADKNNRLYVLEHKTYGMRPREETLRSNDQFLAYQWLLTQLNFGMRVAGVAYDGLWKRASVPKTVDSRPGTLADLFLRMRLERSPEELEEFQVMLAQEALEMASNPALYINRDSGGSCEWGCGMNKLCLAMSRGEDVAYVTKTNYTAKSNDTLEVEKEVA